MNLFANARNKGIEYCSTEGSVHYKNNKKIEPIDLIAALNLEDGFCLGNIIKYASRFKTTKNLNDLKKISDYAHILCGIKIIKDEI